MSRKVVTYRGVVYPWQCDHMGHMNVTWYVNKFDEGTWLILAEAGMTRERLAQESCGMAAVDQHILYKKELHAGDLVTVTSYVLEVGDKTLTFMHEMTADAIGQLAASCKIIGVHLDLQTRKAKSLPEDIKEKARQLIEPKAGTAPG